MHPLKRLTTWQGEGLVEGLLLGEEGGEVRGRAHLTGTKGRAGTDFQRVWRRVAARGETWKSLGRDSLAEKL